MMQRPAWMGWSCAMWRRQIEVCVWGGGGGGLRAGAAAGGESPMTPFVRSSSPSCRLLLPHPHAPCGPLAGPGGAVTLQLGGLGAMPLAAASEARFVELPVALQARLVRRFAARLAAQQRVPDPLTGQQVGRGAAACR
jgi:hypothetical protein